MEKDNILVFLPDEKELIFYQSMYFTLNELLKKVPHTFASDIIKQELLKTKNKLMEIQSRQPNKTPTVGS